MESCDGIRIRFIRRSHSIRYPNAGLSRSSRFCPTLQAGHRERPVMAIGLSPAADCKPSSRARVAARVSPGNILIVSDDPQPRAREPQACHSRRHAPSPPLALTAAPAAQHSTPSAPRTSRLPPSTCHRTPIRARFTPLHPRKNGPERRPSRWTPAARASSPPIPSLRTVLRPALPAVYSHPRCHPHPPTNQALAPPPSLPRAKIAQPSPLSTAPPPRIRLSLHAPPLLSQHHHALASVPTNLSLPRPRSRLANPARGPPHHTDASQWPSVTAPPPHGPTAPKSHSHMFRQEPSAS